jgi:tRNA nucleotidyltransferase (CCA-adding enzyme)
VKEAACYDADMKNPFAVDRESLRKTFLQTHAAAPLVSALAARVPNVYIVGGFVRDLLRGELSADVDLEVYGISAEDLEVLLRELFPDQVHAVGKAFGVYRIPAGQGFLDVALPRRESKTGSGHKGFSVTGDPSLSIVDAARRRDFTINAMLMDAREWTMQDPYGGQADLQSGVLRAVDPETFVEDPLRVYRAVQFVARFDLSIEPSTFELLRSMVVRGDLSTLSKERVTEEMRKLFLKSPRPSRGFEVMDELGIIDREYPELAALHGTEQEPEWHPEGDVWVHTLMVIDEAARTCRESEMHEEDRLAVMLGALCHDLGKPATTRVMEGRIRSRGHEEAGVEPARVLLARWTFSQDACNAAYAAAAEHLKPAMLWREVQKGTLTLRQYENAVRRLIQRIAPVDWRVLLAVAEADWLGRGISLQTEELVSYGKAFVDAVRALEARAELGPVVYGRDVLACGVPAGPRVGEILKEIEAARDRGDISTREEAIALLKKICT